MSTLRIGLAQINTTVGDFQGNLDKISRSIDDARPLKIDLLVFPELSICGYPPEDLLLKPGFIEENLASLGKVVRMSSGITLIVGFVDSKEDIYNSAAIIHDGVLAGVYHKIYLPNYGVFDENRYFQAGNECQVFQLGGIGIGVNICEDIWYEAGPTTTQACAGAELIVNLNASPYYTGKCSSRERMLSTRAMDNVAFVAYCNLVGGQDELVFDGNSLVMDERGGLVARGEQFKEDLVVADLDIEAIFRTRLHDPRWRKQGNNRGEKQWHVDKIPLSDALFNTSKPTLTNKQSDTYDQNGEVYNALVLGTSDYVTKNGFRKVVVGLSGGVDSSLVAAIAVDALGEDNVTGVFMPSSYTSIESKADAELLAANLGITFMTIPIEKVFNAFLETIAQSFGDIKPDVTEENLQARIRGNILMALSNKFGWMVLATGNKSEIATGYATLYGDMAGGLAVIKDVQKTMVYKLAKYRNASSGQDLIPSTVMEKEPTAELRPGQRDIDTLPPYDILDPILTAYVEEDKSIEQIIAMGFDEDPVNRAAKLVDRSEYKRRQAPPGIKITPRAFGRDQEIADHQSI